MTADDMPDMTEDEMPARINASAFHDGHKSGDRGYWGLNVAPSDVPYIRADLHEALQAENARLREACERALLYLNIMSDTAFTIRLEGTSEWDQVAGGADMYSTIDQVNAALGDTDDG